SFSLTDQSGVTIDARQKKSRVMPRRRKDMLQQARERIARIRAALNAMEYLCSGTLLRRTKVCGKPSCRCAQDPSAGHGPYYEWGHLKGAKLTASCRPSKPHFCDLPLPTIGRRGNSYEPGRKKPSASLMPKRPVNAKRL